MAQLYWIFLILNLRKKITNRYFYKNFSFSAYKFAFYRLKLEYLLFNIKYSITFFGWIVRAISNLKSRKKVSDFLTLKKKFQFVHIFFFLYLSSNELYSWKNHNLLSKKFSFCVCFVIGQMILCHFFKKGMMYLKK